MGETRGFSRRVWCLGGYAAVVFSSSSVLSGFIPFAYRPYPTERSRSYLQCEGGLVLAAACFAASLRPTTNHRCSPCRSSPRLVAQSQASGWSVAFGMTSVMLFAAGMVAGLHDALEFPAWSLSVECAFYALFPWLARLRSRAAPTGRCRRKLRSHRADRCLPRRALVACWACLGRCRRAIGGELSAFPILYLPLFIFGMALARLYLFGRVLSPRLHAARCLGIRRRPDRADLW